MKGAQRYLSQKKCIKTDAYKEICWVDAKITYGQSKQDNAPSCPFKHFRSMSPDSDILPYSPYSLEYCYCCTKNGGAFPDCCLSNFLTPLTINY